MKPANPEPMWVEGPSENQISLCKYLIIFFDEEKLNLGSMKK